jgi:glycosyltransferase involved in cell wall biosynthesis
LPRRIGVNALYLIPGGVGGTEIYLRRLLQALARIDQDNQYLVFTNRETESLAPNQSNFVTRPQPVAARFRPARILYEQLILPHVDSVDVWFHPGFTCPLFTRRAGVTVFHDLQHKAHPEHFRWFDRPFWNLFLYQAAKTSTEIISVSDQTRYDLFRYYQRDSHVIPHGVDERFFELSPNWGAGRYLLCVSTLHPHKNLDRLLQAFARFHARHPDYRLVLAGMKGFWARQLEQRIVELGVAAAVEVTGWLEQEKLYALYQGAAGFVYPSTFEGFGMPVLEAMAAGLPLACSQIPPLVSLVQNHGLLFPAHDVAAISQALNKLVEAPPDPRPAQERARHFTWERTAWATRDVLLHAAGVPDHERPRRASQASL